MVTAIIQARLTSTRLPAKVINLVNGKEILLHVADRVSNARLIDNIIVATTDDANGDVIRNMCDEHNILVYQGSENDVLNRYFQCAKKYNLKDIVRVTADCPLIDSNIIDRVTDFYLNRNYDYVTNSMEYTYPDGYDVEIFSFESLRISEIEAILPSEREHVTLYIRKNSKFKKFNIKSDKIYSMKRCSVDYPEDLIFITKIFEALGSDCNIDEVSDFVAKNPSLLNINQHIPINDGMIKSLRDDTKFLNNHESEQGNLE